MRKKILSIALALTMLMGTALTAFAAEGNPTVTFSEDKVLTYSNITETAEGSVSLGSAFEAVLPGETRSQVITLKNDNAQTVDFYMSTAVVQSLEEANKASGAAYEIKLTAGESVLYDSSLGGYEASAQGNTEGLAELNGSLEGDVFVATLEEGQTADVVLTIYFDGEAMDNTSVSDYSNAFGALDFNFKAGYEEPNNEQIVEKIVVRKGETIYEKEIVEIVDESTPLAVKTGDNTYVWVAVAVLVLGVLLFAMTGKKKDKKGLGLFIGALLCTMTWSVSAEAAGTYTVTYRPGNVGKFALADTGETEVKAMAEEAAAAMGYRYDYEVTENGAIKLFVPKGALVPAAPSYIVAKDNYFAKNATIWGPAQGQVVEKNIDFVVDYGKLVDGVEYTIQYLDSEDFSSVAPVAIAYGNIGAEETAVAPEMIVLSGATTYVRDSEPTQSIVLGEDASENVITFFYTAKFVGDVTEKIIYQDVPGETVVVTEYVLIDNGTVVNPGAVLAPDQEENPVGPVVEIPEENVPLVPVPGDEQPQTSAEPSVENPVVDIPEEDVPLASAPSDSGDRGMDIVDIGEEEVPLINEVPTDGKGIGMYIGLGAALVLLFVVMYFWFKLAGPKKVKKEENIDE